MKWFLRITLVLFVSVVLSFFNIVIDADMLNIVFTVLGIMFPIMLSQIMAFSFLDIKNKKIVSRYRENLNTIRTTSVVLFSIETALFLFKKESFFFFNMDTLCFSFLIFCFAYFMVNFLKLAKLKDEIEDDIRKSRCSE